MLVIALIFSTGFLCAQTLNVKGVVTDATGETLPGVNVIVKNTSKGDVTDFDGNYSISGVEKGATLVFSFLGFQTKEVIVGIQIFPKSLDTRLLETNEIDFF